MLPPEQVLRRVTFAFRPPQSGRHRGKLLVTQVGKQRHERVSVDRSKAVASRMGFKFPFVPCAFCCSSWTDTHRVGTSPRDTQLHQALRVGAFLTLYCKSLCHCVSCAGEALSVLKRVCCLSPGARGTPALPCRSPPFLFSHTFRT